MIKRIRVAVMSAVVLILIAWPLIKHLRKHPERALASLHTDDTQTETGSFNHSPIAQRPVDSAVDASVAVSRKREDLQSFNRSLSAYSDLATCESVEFAKLALEAGLNSDPGKVLAGGESPDEIAQRWSKLAELVQRNGSNCEKTKGIETKEKYNITRRAAIEGDSHAINCFISGRYFSFDWSKPDQSLLDDYVNLSNGFIKKGMENGDWEIVRFLADRIGSDRILVPPGHFLREDTYEAYKLNFLLKLAENSSAHDERVAMQLDNLSAVLSKQDRAIAESDARYLLRTTFARARPLQAREDTCF